MLSRPAPASCTEVRPAAVSSFEMWALPWRPRSRCCSGVKRLARADLREHAARELRDAAGQLTALVAEESAVVGIGCGLGDAREIERLGVVPAGVAAAMVHRDWVIARHLVEILARQRDVKLGVVEHDRFDPLAGRRLIDARLQIGLQLAHARHLAFTLNNSPTPLTWQWQSMKPGVMVAPAASI